MEENKNSAIQKTENIAKNGENSSKKSKAKTKKGKTVKKSDAMREKKAIDRARKKENAQKARLAKQQQAKKRKEDLNKARMEKKAQIKKLKLEKKEERRLRQQSLKHASKSERAKILAKEKQERLNLKKERIQAERERKRQLALEKQKNRELKQKNARERRKNRRGIGGWLAAVISLGCAVLILGGLLTLSLFTPLDEYMMTNTAEQRSFYDLVGYVNNLDVNLSKLTVSADSEEQQKILGDVRVQSSLASNSISTLALRDEDKFYTTKFINQVGDFAKYLNNKLIEGESMSNEDKETLKSMHEINAVLKNELASLSASLGEDFDFNSIYEGKSDNIIISKFTELESNAVNYPEMIYDGAFSDSKISGEARSIKNLKEITKLEAEEVLKKYLSPYNLTEVTLIGETTSQKVNCYNFQAVDKDGVETFAQITKNGGKLIIFNHFKDCESDAYSLENCQDVASRFLSDLGYKNVKAVWATEGNNVATFNFAYTQDGIICYNDLIKVNVCKERGIVSSIDASSYILNHKERPSYTAKISVNEAKQKISKQINVSSSRLAIIPKGEFDERLAYEFVGTNSQGETYYFYIDAVTGKEADIFKVVETTEGTLVL